MIGVKKNSARKGGGSLEGAASTELRLRGDPQQPKRRDIEKGKKGGLE